MRGGRTGAAALLPALSAPLVLAALAGCGIQGTGVVEAGGAATVVVQPIPEDRMVLYFLGPDGRTMPMVRDVGGFGSGVPFPVDGPEGERWTYDGFGPDHEASAGASRASRTATDKVLAALLAGPRPPEAAAGVTTALPKSVPWTPHVEADPAGTASARRVRVSFPVRNLPGTALRQLVCTTAHAETPGSGVEVAVAGPDGTLPAARCEE